jgi:hypothetical protein
MTTQSNSFSEIEELSHLDDPAVRNRCVKLKWRSDLQNQFPVLAFILFLLTFFLLKWGYLGFYSRHGGEYSPPASALIPIGWTTLEISLALLISLLGFRNYCLLDPLERRLYQHVQFLWWRRRRIVFRAGEILAITTDGQPRAFKGGILWYYRLIAVGFDGRKAPLSNWRQAGLDEWNAKAPELASQLGCESCAAPPQSIVSVEDKDGAPTLKFASPAPSPPPKAKRVTLLLLVTAVPMIVLLYYFIVMRATR